MRHGHSLPLWTDAGMLELGVDHLGHDTAGIHRAALYCQNEHGECVRLSCSPLDVKVLLAGP